MQIWREGLRWLPDLLALAYEALLPKAPRQAPLHQLSKAALSHRALGYARLSLADVPHTQLFCQPHSSTLTFSLHR
jgi:hypothetical protein